MKGLLLFVIIFFSLIFLVAIGHLIYILNSDSSEVDSFTPKSGKPFQLSIGENFTLRGSEIKVNFLRVSQDSRCPMSVNCVSAGEVDILFNVFNGNRTLETFTLTKGIDNNNDLRTLEGYEIELVSVDPYPEYPNSIESSDYVLTMSVDKA